ncbi:hypothetical protein [Asticcacaulis sp. MM231]|uniref:hypothetical protein n=1 Tax=Asticcacaulis sp. MM231 TaxID=3157666 RepID=UPI0032D5680D
MSLAQAIIGVEFDLDQIGLFVKGTHVGALLEQIKAVQVVIGHDGALFRRHLAANELHHTGRGHSIDLSP